MCVIFLAYEMHPAFPLIVLANRDEFYDRPTESAGIWRDFPDIFAGRDLVGGGTWLGVNRRGEFAAVTNYRDPRAAKGRHSRGRLVADFLKSDEAAEIYLQNVKNRAVDFSGFNLLAGELSRRKSEIFYFSNREGSIRKLEKGLYGLSNHLLDTPWRKIEKGKADFSELLKKETVEKQSFFDLLADGTLADDGDLPDTGIGYEKEKLLSSIFIKTPVYGTRCSTVLTFDNDFEPDFEERVFV